MNPSSPEAVVTGSSSREEVDEFLALLLADSDLLAAEFDEIVSRAWAGQASPAAPSTRREVAGPSPCSVCAEPDAAPDRGPVHPPGPRVRSPPR
jgi:hypothetical protein